ncbi:MAG: BON domain-containing protein, partial [Nitrospira sp.]|nr:BON domain-containing protein [Nitrospira sp.]
MDTWNVQRTALAALVLAWIVLPALPSPGQAQDSAVHGARDGNQDITVYGGNTRHNTGARPWRKMSDAQLKTKVEKELAESPFANGDKIDVLVKKGNVTLEGTVQNPRTLEDAIDSAREAGARKVFSKLKTREENDLTVYPGLTRYNTGARPWREKSDAELKTDVEQELADGFFVNEDKIDVSVKKGNVTLEGTVQNERFLEDAVESAREAGARKVFSKLKTREREDFATYGGYSRHNTGARPWREKSDAELKTDVEQELADGFFVNEDKIDVSVKKGNVTLEGTVQNERFL